MSDLDRRDARLARRMLLGTSALAALLIALLLLALATSMPLLSEWAEATFNDGIGLAAAALAAIAVSIVMVVIFAVVAGDGLIGELQFMIPGFFLFFVFFWLMLAWVF